MQVHGGAVHAVPPALVHGTPLQQSLAFVHCCPYDAHVPPSGTPASGTPPSLQGPQMP